MKNQNTLNKVKFYLLQTLNLHPFPSGDKEVKASFRVIEMRKRKSLSAFKIWRFLLQTGVKLDSDGYYRLSGVFGHSVTFGRLRIEKEGIREIRSRDGSLKQPFLDKLARFVRDERNSMSPLSNAEIVIIGLNNILRKSKTKS